MGLTNPSGVLELILLRSTSPRLSTLSGIPLSFKNLFRLAHFLGLLVGINHFFLICALAWFIKITQVSPFESVDVFGKHPFVALYFYFFPSMIFLRPYLLPSAVLFMLTTWPFGPPISPFFLFFSYLYPLSFFLSFFLFFSFFVSFLSFFLFFLILLSFTSFYPSPIYTRSSDSTGSLI